MAKFTKKSAGGTSFHGITITTTLQKLKGLFPYSHELGDGEKSYNNFTLENSQGNVFTIYDWKEGYIEPNQEVEFHIGGNCKNDTILAKGNLMPLLK